MGCPATFRTYVTLGVHSGGACSCSISLQILQKACSSVYGREVPGRAVSRGEHEERARYRAHAHGADEDVLGGVMG